MIRRLATAAVAALLTLTAAPAPAHATTRDRDVRPVVFVHGSAGSATQFQTQAKRLASNGYPAALVEAHEYDSTFQINTLAAVWAGLDARIERLLVTSGADRVDILAHSLGTFVTQGYLNSSPQRAARVAHYVNLDGAIAAAPPGGVPTLAIWGEGNPARAIVGATNVYLPDQSHTQSVTSVESFTSVYRFLTGREPHTTRVRLEHRIELSGRAVIFPLNSGVTGARLEAYRLHPFTGTRAHHRPIVLPIAADGSWGPMRAEGEDRYEFAIVREGAPTHHFYFQPFRRTDHLIRLQTSVPGQGLGALVEASERHVAVTINRQKEWWGDQTEGNDTLWVNGDNILNAANSPRTKRVIGIFAYDRNVDGVTDLAAPIPAFFAQTFITGIDVFIPAAPRHLGLTVLASRQRGTSELDVITIPAWPSNEHRSTVHFNDHTQ